MEYILRTNTVSKKYTNYYAVDKVSISIKKGEIYGLIGENGAGKSTLMKMIAGLVEPSEGSIELFGNFVPQTERYRIGCVIESPALYAELTAKQNLEVFRNAYGLSSKESVQQILKQVGLSQYENKIVKKFSLGMKQRLAIGIALLGNPDFLILDEPINGLDPTGIQDMRNFLLKLNREEHITIMISSHILGELSKIATKYGIIKNGKLIEEITAKELNEKCQCCLKIKASDTAQAAILIEKNLHTKNYEILSDNNIRIFEYVDNPGIVNSLLVNHGISVDECNLIRADFYKTIHGKVLKVCFLMMTGWIFLCAYAQKATIGMREYLVGTEVSANYWDSFFNYYPVVFPLIVFCSYYFSNDFRQGTVKHYIEKGLSRWSYFFSKLVIGWIVSSFFLVSAFLIGLLCNKIFFGISGFTFTNISNIVSYIFCEALYHMAVSTLAISLVFLIRNSSVSMAVNALLIFFGYLVLHGLESILGLGYNITIFWAISNINKTRIDMAVQWLPTAIIIFFAYMIIFGGVIGTIFKKRDIT